LAREQARFAGRLMASGGRRCSLADELGDGRGEFGGVGERGEVIQVSQGLRACIGQHLGQDRGVVAEPRAGFGSTDQERRCPDPGRLGRPEGPGGQCRQLVGEEIGRLVFGLETYLGRSLRPGLTVKYAAERYGALLSPELHHLLTVEHRWSTQRYASWVTDLLDHDLLA
jgi:hypothetical protein